jgi:hypothetical protein
MAWYYGQNHLSVFHPLLFFLVLFFAPLLFVSFPGEWSAGAGAGLGGFSGRSFAGLGWVERRIKRHSTHTRRERHREREKEAILLMMITLLTSFHLFFPLLLFVLQE